MFTGRAEPHLPHQIPRPFDHFFCQLFAGWCREQHAITITVDIELRDDGFFHFDVAVADARNGSSSRSVEKLLSIGKREVVALRADYFRWRDYEGTVDEMAGR